MTSERPDPARENPLHERDLRNLTELLSRVDTLAIDEFFAKGKRGIVPDEALDYSDAFSAQVNSSEFQINNVDLEKAIRAFSDAWDVSVAYGDYFFPLISGEAYKFKSPYDTDDPDEVTNARTQFDSDLLIAERKYNGLIAYINAHYPEVDFKETNRQARESYVEKSDRGGEASKEQPHQGDVVQSRVEGDRGSSGKISILGWMARVGAVVTFIVVVAVGAFGNNAYAQFTGRSFYQDLRNFLSGTPIVTATDAMSAFESSPTSLSRLLQTTVAEEQIDPTASVTPGSTLASEGSAQETQSTESAEFSPTSPPAQPATPLPPPTSIPVPTPTPTATLEFVWSDSVSCDAESDIVENRVHNLNQVTVLVSGFIDAQPDGEAKANIALVPSHSQTCPAGAWCGPIAEIRNPYPDGFKGVISGTTFVHLDGILQAENTLGPERLECTN